MSQSESNFRIDLVELLAGNALGDLDAVELQRLAEQLSEEDKQNAEELQWTVGALQLAFANQTFQPMPTSLKAKIASEAPLHIRPQSPSTSSVESVQRSAPLARISRRERLAWLITAASILLAVGIWFSNNQTSESPVLALNALKARSELIAQSSDHIEIAWVAGTTPFDAPVSGDVVWSNSLQKGFLRFVGMPINDPTLQQYQLWIIDPSRDDKPIDGGVFDVTSEGEVIIPIDAKLNVIDPAAFAVTIEKPGGVVVSDQKRLPLLAKVVTKRT